MNIDKNRNNKSYNKKNNNDHKVYVGVVVVTCVCMPKDLGSNRIVLSTLLE